MNLHKKPCLWEVEIEATPKDENVIGNYVMKFEVEAVSQVSAIAAARKKIIAKHALKSSEYRTKTISCNELKK